MHRFGQPGCAQPEFTIDAKQDCSCGPVNALSVGTLAPGEYIMTYVSGKVRTGSTYPWNYSYPGSCKGRGNETCWALYSNFGKIAFEEGLVFSVATETPLLVWYQDNGCGNNEGTITYRVTSTACL